MSFAIDPNFDFVDLSPDDVELSPTQIDAAIQSSQSVDDPTQQWQAYLNLLAREAVMQWLGDRVPEKHSRNQSTNFEIGTQIEITGFKLDILALGSVTEAELLLPADWLQSPALAAHFYIVVEVLEDLELARIYGFMARDRLLSQNPLLRRAHYTLALNRCDRDLNTLLLYLRCLDPHTIPLPQPPINVAAWLQNRVDAIADELTWTLLPLFDPNLKGVVPGMRSSGTQLHDILQQIQQNNAPITHTAHTAFQDIAPNSADLRLYAVIWAETPPELASEWNLILILGTPSGENLPDRTRFTIRDDNEILLEEITESPCREPYLYVHIIGELHESFTVELAIADGTSLTLPPFVFNPHRSIVVPNENQQQQPPGK